MPHATRFTPLYVLLLATLLFVGCDQGTLTATEDGADKSNLSVQFDQVPSDTPITVEEDPAPLHSLALSKNDDIEGQYIVVFKDNVAAHNVPSMASSMAQAQRGQVIHSYSNVIKGFAAKMSKEAAAELAKDLNVAFVEPDQKVYAIATQSNPTWGLDRVDQSNLPLDNAYTYNFDGSGVRAYIIDTGIRTSHAEFGGRASAGFDAFGGNGQDCNGHGTHVAGTVGSNAYGLAKNVTLIGVRVLNCSGSGSNSGVIAGVDYVTQQKQSNPSIPMVANMSLGGGASTALDNAIRNSVAAGVTYAVAAGNENQNACNVSPARVGEALTVGSTTSSDNRSSFSNYGTCVDLFAPGSSITSTWSTSNTAINTISGTSMASPHVAGAAALYLDENPSASPATVFSAITNSATSGVVGNRGSGSPNLLLNSLFGSNPDPDPDPDPDPAPCTGCDLYTGSLSGTGSSQYQPNGTYYSSGSGTHRGYLRGPANADFDLYLYKWNGRRWNQVATGTSPNSDEDIIYTSSSGYFYWRIYSYSGSGAYDFYLDRP